jgi:aspartate aminotransferase
MFYVGNHGGVIKPFDTTEDFHLDLEKVEKAITRRTKAIIVNSPNNPTGVVYTEEELRALAELLHTHKKKGHRIYIIADEAYRKLVYNGTVLPEIFQIYEDTIVVTCHSKDLGLAGERIGYIAVSPSLRGGKALIDAAIFANRILGFINAPALMQRLVGRFQKSSVDIADYQIKRDALYDVLVDAGFEVVKPKGAFYMFPKSPDPDDIRFVKKMLEHRILAVPGIGFGKAGYFRLAYCVETEKIEPSRPYFKEVMREYR